MMAFIGMFFQDGLTGSAWGDWALYTVSPLRWTVSLVLFCLGFHTKHYFVLNSRRDWHADVAAWQTRTP